MSESKIQARQHGKWINLSQKIYDEQWNLYNLHVLKYQGIPSAGLQNKLLFCCLSRNGPHPLTPDKSFFERVTEYRTSTCTDYLRDFTIIIS